MAGQCPVLTQPVTLDWSSLAFVTLHLSVNKTLVTEVQAKSVEEINPNYS